MMFREIKQTMNVGKKVLVAALLVALTLVYILHIRKDMSDFGVYYAGGERILKGETLYRASDGHLQFKYAPASALFMAGLTVLPYEAAKAVWFLLSLYFFYIIVRSGLKLLPPAHIRKGLLLALGFLVIAKYLARELELGQVNLLILFLLGITATSLRDGRQIPAGIMAGLSLFLKPYALVFLPYFLIKKKWKAFLTALGTACAGFALPMIVYGPGGTLAVHKEWVSSLRLSTRDLLTVGDNASLYAFFAKNLGPLLQGRAAAIFTAAAVVILALLMLVLIRAGRKVGTVQAGGLEIAFLLVLIPLLSPLGWIYNYLYGFWAILFLIAGMEHFPVAVRCLIGADLAMIGLSLIELIGRRAFDFYNGRALAAVNFLVVLGGLAWLRLKGRA